MKMLLTLSVVLLSTAAAAKPDAPQSSRKATSPDSDRVICRRQADISSRLTSRRVCMTEAQWNEYRREARYWLEPLQPPTGQ